MTLPTLIELQCPSCSKVHWIIDHLFQGSIGQQSQETDFSAQPRTCPHCKAQRTGFKVVRTSSESFLISSRPSMTRKEFDYWVKILRTHFPDHPRLKERGPWEPYTPEEHERDVRREEEEQRRLLAAIAPQAENQYPFQTKVGNWAVRFCKDRTGVVGSRSAFLLSLSATDGTIEEEHFPQGTSARFVNDLDYDAEALQKKEKPHFLFRPFWDKDEPPDEADSWNPIFIASWNHLPRPAMESLIGTSFTSADWKGSGIWPFRRKEALSDFPTKWRMYCR